MIHFIDKPGFYRTYSAESPTLVTPVEAQRSQCVPLILKIVNARQTAALRTLMANHGAKNLKEISDDDVPVFLAELRAVTLVLGLA